MQTIFDEYGEAIVYFVIGLGILGLLSKIIEAALFL